MLEPVMLMGGEPALRAYVEITKKPVTKTVAFKRIELWKVGLKRPDEVIRQKLSSSFNTHESFHGA